MFGSVKSEYVCRRNSKLQNHLLRRRKSGILLFEELYVVVDKTDSSVEKQECKVYIYCAVAADNAYCNSCSHNRHYEEQSSHCRGTFFGFVPSRANIQYFLSHFNTLEHRNKYFSQHRRRGKANYSSAKHNIGCIVHT